MSIERTRISITGGGTGGHLSPAIATIEALRSLAGSDRLDLLYIGSRDGPEARVIPAMGVAYTAVSTGKLRRYLSVQNLLDLGRIPLGVAQALARLARFRPHVVFATGGFVSVPAVLAAAVLRRPVLVHEQTASLGLANRINARFATKVALSVPGSESGLPPGKWVHTGNPLRAAVRSGDETRAQERWGFDPDLPTIYITGGAQGAHAINVAVAEALPSLLALTQVIHQCGDAPGVRADYDLLAQRSAELPSSLRARYRLCRWVGEEIGDVYAISDVVVGRAGAGTVNEIAGLGNPAILIPLTHAAGDEQRQNARRLSDLGAAVVIEESELTPERLVDELATLFSDPELLQSMAEASHSAGFGDADKRLAKLVLELAGAAPR
jgi:UDP-N-acetylglucosamine--N-acetylmuramyl-(pentapeptide) pyrophosphoryl-undecaprenol N-acetylglucosamine transferase